MSKRSSNKEINIDDFHSRIKKLQELELEARQKEEEEEQKRINDIKCPVCKSKEKQRYQKWDNNGIIGHGSRGWITEDYLVCLSCGIHYTDINKPKE